MAADESLAVVRMARRRRVAVLGAVVAGLLLAGCSASGGSDATAEMPAAEGAGGAMDQAASEETAAGSSSALPDSGDRMVVKDGELYVTVDDPVAAAAQAAMVVDRLDGRVDQREIQAGYEGQPGSASLTLRVPAGSLDEAVADLGALGEVSRYSESTRDVTDTAVDLDARIDAGRTSVARVEEFLERAQDATELLATERELSQRQADLESLEAQRAALADQVSMSTLYVSLTAPGDPVVERPGPRTFVDGLGAGWRSLWTTLRGFAVVVGVLLPWAALAAVVFLAVWLPLRASRARRTPPTPPGPGPILPPRPQTRPPAPPTDAPQPPSGAAPAPVGAPPQG